MYESIIDENAYETTECATTKAIDSPYEELNAIAPECNSTNLKNPTYAETNAIATEYSNPNTALKNINFSHYNLPDHLLLQTYKSMLEDRDKLFVEEFKVSKNVAFDELLTTFYSFRVVFSNIFEGYLR